MYFASCGAAISIALLSFAFYPRQLERHPAFALHAKPKFVDKIADAAHHRLHPILVSPKPWSSGTELELRPAYKEWRGAGGDPPLAVRTDKICFPLYISFDHWAIHGYGLTDAVLARVDIPANRPAHKDGLARLGEHIGVVMKWWGRSPAPGMYRAAVQAGIAAPWMKQNLEVLERIEKRLYNTHDLSENLALALKLDDRIYLAR